ncbi:hypothetical protein AHF37_06672 [Paragonimus kellicotti]|nr:hypothetical protein AHF37_06672 [Paragonimus kellicotti]
MASERHDSSITFFRLPCILLPIPPADSTGFCRTESYQAIKVSWAKLSTISPTLHQLVSRMYPSNDEYSELLETVRQSIQTLRQTNSSQVDVRSVYRTHAFSWLRRNPTKWKWWTANW